MKKRTHGIEAVKRKYGYYFVAPWLFGIAVFVLRPLLTSIYYAFTHVKFVEGGIAAEFAGMKWFRYLLVEDADFIDQAASSLQSLLTSLPIIISLSMILAIVLNQKFKGRLLARSVFFLPVIIASGPVMSVLAEFTMQEGLSSSFGAADAPAAAYMEVINFQDILARLELPAAFSSFISGYLSDIFNLIWSCGVQILLFVAGLQTIPSQLYEVSKVEGASVWEEFWYITVPMLGRTILLVSFYTMVELFVNNSVVVNRATTLIRKQIYDECSAMLWMYFLLVGAVMGLLLFLYHRLCLKRWES